MRAILSLIGYFGAMQFIADDSADFVFHSFNATTVRESNHLNITIMNCWGELPSFQKIRFPYQNPHCIGAWDAKIVCLQATSVYIQSEEYLKKLPSCSRGSH